jgi:two-component system response regulator
MAKKKHVLPMEAQNSTHRTVRVLIVDDSEQDQVLFRHILQTCEDVEVIGTATNGTDAIAYLNGVGRYHDRHTHRKPHVMLLDFQMPGLSGLDVVRKIGMQPHHCRVVLWSDSVELINQPLAYQLGASVVCKKPQNRSDLVSILSEAVTAPSPHTPGATVHTLAGQHRQVTTH